MAEYLSIQEIDILLKQAHIADEILFSIIKSISLHLNQGQSTQVQEVILRVIEKKDQFKTYKPIINDFARVIGLFPYLDPSELNLSDKIAYQFHKPGGSLQENIVFHRVQAKVYLDILDGKNIILSAPTSFGKSLIIDAIINAKEFDNIVIVVPTIALIDETRRRLSKFNFRYKIITHITQSIKQKNIFILTQERVMQMDDNIKVDFFVIDEFYKINLKDGDENRSMILNQAFYKLLKKGGQFYLLGPNVENVNSAFFPKNVSAEFIKTDYKTVITEKIIVSVGDSSQNALIELCRELREPTLIFCKSPKSANNVAKLLISSGFLEKSTDNIHAVTWLRKEFHTDWNLPLALEHSIGLHHGKIPRAISQYFVRAFNDRKIRFLICTSTLIEGVNTSAKNVIIYDNKIANDEFDFFTFNNICGRSGRMFKHFVGKVYLFHHAPNEELPVVDFPVFSQGDDTPTQLLIQVENEDLALLSKQRIEAIFSNDVLSISTIRKNSSIDPFDQINLARHIKRNLREFYPSLNWVRFPTYEKLEFACELLWEYLIKAGHVGGISSGRQLAFKVNELRSLKSIKALIKKDVANETDPDKINDHIDDILEFSRYWAQFHFPNYLNTLDLIQQEIYSNAKMKTGSYSFFGSQVECLFTKPLFAALDEYGIPMQTSNKIKHRLNTTGTLDDLLIDVKNLNTINLEVSEFEKELIIDAQVYI